MPLVSVIIPAHNAQSVLGVTIRSMLDQSLTDWEAIVCDDGSTDGTAGILSDFTWRDPRVRLHRSDAPGLAASMNAGVDAAGGDYVLLLEPGSWVSPLGVEHLLQAAEWSGLGAACGPVALHGADGRAFDVVARSGAERIGPEELLGTRCLIPRTHLVRRDLLRDLRADPSLHCFHDLDLSLRLAARGLRWACVESLVSHARVRPGARGRDLRRCLDAYAEVVSRTSLPGPLRRDSLRRAALFFATTAALTGSTGSGARAMLRAGDGGPSVYTASELGAAAYWALVLGFAIPPRKIAPSIDAWRPRLERWWSEIPSDDGAEALRWLAHEAIQPEMVAEAMLSRVPRGGPAVLAGALGHNGRILASKARTHGVRITPRDDRLPRARIERLIDADSVVLVAPSDDASVMEQLPRDASVVRWSSTRCALAERLHRHFLEQGQPAEIPA